VIYFYGIYFYGKYFYGIYLFGILGRGLRRALIRCTLGSGKSEEGLGFWRGGHKGTMGNEGEQFTDNLGPRWTIPVTTGGSQVSRRVGIEARGMCISRKIIKA
jgi:hypothetical protein